jgi:hypothetical protein
MIPIEDDRGVRYRCRLKQYASRGVEGLALRNPANHPVALARSGNGGNSIRLQDDGLGDAV